MSGFKGEPGACALEDRDMLRCVAGLLKLGTWEWDNRAGKLRWSSGLLELLGVSENERTTSARVFFERVHPEDRDGVEEAFEGHLQRETLYDACVRLRHEDGHHVEVRMRAFAQRSAQGVRLLGVALESSAPRDAAHRLERYERRLKAIAAQVPGAVFQYRLNPDGTDAIAFMSDGSVSLWEHTPEELEAEPALAWGQVIPEDVAGLQQSVMHSAETLEQWDHTWRITTPSGVSKVLRGGGLPTRAADGSVTWNSVLMDVTRSHEAERALAQSQEMLLRAQKMESMGQLTGGLAHDFNNLLMVVLSSLERLKMSPDLDPHGRSRILDDALRATQRGASLTKSLLSFARRAPLQPEQLQLCAVLNEMSSMLERVLPANISMEVIDCTEPCLIQADRASLESAILNLVLNARDAINGEGMIQLEARLCEDVAPAGLARGAYVELSVSDNGCGIPEEHLSRVLEPFFTTKGSEGSGMGLAMIHGFVEQSGGAMEVVSKRRRGTHVSMWFPALENILMARTSSATGSFEVSGVRARVLLVEDQDAVRAALVGLLEHSEFVVVEARDGAEAVALLDAPDARFDIVLTDMEMPGELQGTDLAARFGHAMPVVLCSGNPPVHEVSGVAAFLTKPVGLKQLQKTMSQAIAQFWGERATQH